VITAGWVSGAVLAGALVALLASTLRSRPSPEAGPCDELYEEVARAREAWHDALLERGILPFLREALADPSSAALGRRPSPAPSRIPQLGYNRPGFSSPDSGPAAGPRPSFTSPDFTSPDFGGPEHQPE
jgi:hypothetical protein